MDIQEPDLFAPASPVAPDSVLDGPETTNALVTLDSDDDALLAATKEMAVSSPVSPVDLLDYDPNAFDLLDAPPEPKEEPIVDLLDTAPDIPTGDLLDMAVSSDGPTAVGAPSSSNSNSGSSSSSGSDGAERTTTEDDAVVEVPDDPFLTAGPEVPTGELLGTDDVVMAPTTEEDKVEDLFQDDAVDTLKDDANKEDMNIEESERESPTNADTTTADLLGIETTDKSMNSKDTEHSDLSQDHPDELLALPPPPPKNVFQCCWGRRGK